MTKDTIPQSSQSDGRWKISQVGKGLDATSAAIVGAGKQLTYSFTPGGFDWQTTQAEVADPRLTLDTDLSRPGKKKETLNLNYVDSQDPDSAAVLLTEGSEGQFAVRRGVPNEDDWAADDVADIITYVLGAQRPDAPTENGVDTISQQAFITNITQRKVALLA